MSAVKNMIGNGRDGRGIRYGRGCVKRGVKGPDSLKQLKTQQLRECANWFATQVLAAIASKTPNLHQHLGDVTNIALDRGDETPFYDCARVVL